jgi:hypothetical protein
VDILSANLYLLLKGMGMTINQKLITSESEET